jgi:hypothetical protein
MAITVKIAAKTAAEAPAAGNEFVTTGPFVLHGDDFTAGKRAYLMRLGPSGAFRHATNKDGRIFVSDNPNMVYVDAAGTYRLDKDATQLAACVGYEEQ